MRYPETATIAPVLSLLLLAAMPALAQNQENDRSERKPSSTIAPLEEIRPVDPHAAAAPVDPKSYVIGAEDQLGIQVWREPEVSGAVIVRPDGRITLPLIGEVQAGGKTPEELTKVVAERLSEFLNRPEVMVSVTNVRSKKYFITGQVYRTGAFPLVVPTTILEALSASGGFQQWAKRKKIIVLRGDKRIKFNYNDVIKGKNPDQNIYLENGDHIIVP